MTKRSSHIIPFRIKIQIQAQFTYVFLNTCITWLHFTYLRPEIVDHLPHFRKNIVNIWYVHLYLIYTPYSVFNWN